jgi:DNA-binding transcriptional ArsR family regulator
MEISDPKAIRALAHPLRLDLLKLLGAQGPATAAQCGRALGTSQASCSFHLRQLAKYGLVEDAGPGSDRRERRWRLADPRLSLRIADGADAVLRRRIERLAIEQEMQAILDYSRRPDGAGSQWRHKAGIVSGLAALSPADAAEIKQKWFALLAPYVARARETDADPQPGREMVRFFMALTPLTGNGTADPEGNDGD